MTHHQRFNLDQDTLDTARWCATPVLASELPSSPLDRLDSGWIMMDHAVWLLGITTMVLGGCAPGRGVTHDFDGSEA